MARYAITLSAFASLQLFGLRLQAFCNPFQVAEYDPKPSDTKCIKMSKLKLLEGHQAHSVSRDDKRILFLRYII